MLFRSLAAAAALLAVASPVAAKEPDLRAEVAAYVQPSNEARTGVVVAQLRAAGFEPTVETFTGGNPRTGETVDVPAKAVPFFKSGKELRERLNAGDS